MTSAALLGLVSPAVAIAIAFWGFQRSRRADKLRAFFEVYERYLTKEARTGRREIYQSVAGRSDSELAALSREILTCIGYSLAVMNSIAIACEGGYVDRQLIVRSMGRSFTLAVTAAKPYFDHVERVRGHRPYPFAERLAARLAAEGGWSPPALSSPAAPAAQAAGEKPG
jgi:hypothetical protein